MPSKVLILNTTFKVEGPNAVLAELIRHLDRRRFHPIAACLHGGGPMQDQYDREGVEAHNFHMGGLADLRVVGRLRRFVRRRGIDVIHAQLLRAEFYGSLAGRLSGTPVVVTVANTDPYRAAWRFPVKHALSRVAVSLATRVVAASEGVRDYVKRHQGVTDDRMVVIPNAVSPESYAARPVPDDLARQLNLRDGDRVVCAAGRLDPQKGLEYFIDAIGRVARRRHRVKALILGEGALRPALERQVTSRNLENVVTLGGFRDDLPAVFGATTVFVMPSLWEGLPMALLGAMAAGLPVVATRVAGCADVVVDGETGLLVPPADADALAAGIETLLDDPQRRQSMGDAGRHRIRLRYSANQMARSYEAVYDACLAAGASRLTSL